jgi:CBS domain-containing protein
VERLFQGQVIDAMDKSGQNPYVPLPQDTPLAEVINHLTTETRRIPILSHDGKIVQMVSQSDIVRYIHSTPSHMQALKQKLHQPIADIIHKAISVSPDTRVLDCFAIMVDRRVSALPVVDDDVHALVGVVTLKDISGVFEDTKQLFTPIEDYIAFMRQKNTGTLREFPFISMQATDTLEKALNKMMVAKIHRIFVKQTGTQGVSILTLKDILQALV